MNRCSDGFVRRVRMARTVLIAAGAALALTAQAAWSFPWDIDMYRGEAVQPLSEAPRVMPFGTMPANRGEPPMTVERMTALKNPLSPSSENLAHGKDLFLTNCAPCHGENGSGSGPVVHLLKSSPKNLLVGKSKDSPDGYIYGVIRNGIMLMPSYGDAMSDAERWQVVLYVRSLQQQTGPQNTAGK